MNMEPAISPEPTIGILMMDAPIRRIPGDVGNPATFPFAVRYKTVAGATLQRLITARDRSLIAPFAAAGRELAAQGVKAISTTCGFTILFQRELAAEISVPVFTSSLLQLPFIQAALRTGDRIGVITADASNLTPEHLRRAGGDVTRLTVCGLEDRPAFREAIFSGSGRLDAERVEHEVVEQARGMVASEPAIRAILLECSNLPPYAAAIQQAVGLPVYDFVTLLHHVRLALARTVFN